MVSQYSRSPPGDVTDNTRAFILMPAQSKKLLEFLFIPLVEGSAKELLVYIRAFDASVLFHEPSVEIPHHLKALALFFLCLSCEVLQFPAVLEADRHHACRQRSTRFAQAANPPRKPESCLEDAAVSLAESIHDRQDGALGAGAVFALVLVSEVVRLLCSLIHEDRTPQ